MDEIYNDITQLEPIQVELWSRPYNESEDASIKMKTIQRHYRRAKMMKKRIAMLVYMYFAGELLDNIDDSEYKRVKLIMNKHHYEVSRKVFTIFKDIGMTQLLRTQVLTTTKVQRITKVQILDLISRAKIFLTTFEIQVEGELSSSEINLTAPIISDLWNDDVISTVPNDLQNS